MLAIVGLVDLVVVSAVTGYEGRHHGATGMWLAMALFDIAVVRAPCLAVLRPHIVLMSGFHDPCLRVSIAGPRNNRPRSPLSHTDGFPVDPVDVDALLLGMGERYDSSSEFPRPVRSRLVARAEGTTLGSMASVRTGSGMAPMADATPTELMGRLLSVSDPRATEDVALASRRPDRTYTATLTGDMATYRWSVQAESEEGVSLPVRTGERVRLVLANSTMMWHPLHLHGHTFEVVTGAGAGPRKDTVIVPAGAQMMVDVQADNAGQWVPTTSITPSRDADRALLCDLSCISPGKGGPLAPTERDLRPLPDVRSATRVCPTGVPHVTPAGEQGPVGHEWTPTTRTS